jgi:hypothetical protein
MALRLLRKDGFSSEIRVKDFQAGERAMLGNDTGGNGKADPRE